MPRGLHLSDQTSNENGAIVEVQLNSSPSTDQSQSTSKKIIAKRKPKFEHTKILSVTVDAKGNLKPSNDCAQKITYFFHQGSDAEGVTWKKVSMKRKDFYWGEFKKVIIHEGFDDSVVYKAWNKKAATRYRDWMSTISKLETPVYGVEETVWKAWKAYWSTDEFKIKSERGRNNQNRNGKGKVIHTGGSQTFDVRLQRMREEGLNPDPAEFHKLTHSHKVDNELVFCDEKAAQVNDAYLERERETLLELQTQAELSESSVPTELPFSMKVFLFKEVAGGVKKGSVYGSGSAGVDFYDLKSGAFTSMGCSSGSKEVSELRKKINDIEEKMARENEERDRERDKAVARANKRATKMEKLVKKMLKEMKQKKKKRKNL